MKNLMLAFLLFSSQVAMAQDELNSVESDAPLDIGYENLVHPTVDGTGTGFVENLDQPLNLMNARNDVVSLIASQTPVKSQSKRNTCTIFSATALLESMMIIRGKADSRYDLSEEWLQYLISQNHGSEFSSSRSNFKALRLYGQSSEDAMPYIGEKWKDLSSSNLAQKRCGRLADTRLQQCLVAHRDPSLMSQSSETLSNPSSPYFDPEFLNARNEARKNKALFYGSGEGTGAVVVTSTSRIKELLRKGIPVSVDVNFYYGSWNHGAADKLGIDRDPGLFSSGIVTFPEPGSIDKAISPTKSAGHSVVLVGYDDTVTVRYTKKMTNGETKTFTRTGVYYFKNSWGTSGFGSSFRLDNRRHPGYGVITQDYANQYGQFHEFRLAQ